MTPKNPTDEIRGLRRELTDRLDGDLQRIVDELRSLQKNSGRVFLDLSAEAASSETPSSFPENRLQTPDQKRVATTG